jgi:putative FmdB family regulatory protein
MSRSTSEAAGSRTSCSRDFQASWAGKRMAGQCCSTPAPGRWPQPRTGRVSWGWTAGSGSARRVLSVRSGGRRQLKNASVSAILAHMPIFEYQCRDCGSRFEKISYVSGVEILCKHCSSPKVEKLLSVFAVAGTSHQGVSSEPGPCPCGAPRRGMCGE